MANFRDINSASRNLNRVMDINLEPENRAALEAVMVAMAAGGRVQEMAVIAQTIEKTSVQTDIVGAIADLKTVISGLKPEAKPSTMAIADEQTELAVLRSENIKLQKQLESFK
jgi:hypothetical protein